MKIAVLLTCHNRKQKTLGCLRHLFANELTDHIQMHVILVDDASTDGTAASVQQSFPQVEVLQGNGSLFWNRGMHKAFAHAAGKDFDAYLWLNDDTFLYPKAISTLVETQQTQSKLHNAGVIAVGATQGASGERTYGGLMRESGTGFKFRPVQPEAQPVRCDAMNGNAVLIPREVAEIVGNVDSRFNHGMGDIDYSLRAVDKGVAVYLAPGFVGTCELNGIEGTYNDRSMKRSARWSKIMEPKGLPPSSWYVFTRRHCGPMWPLHWLWPYVKIWLR